MALSDSKPAARHLFSRPMARGAKNKLGDGRPWHSNRTKMGRFNRTASRTEARELKRLLHPDRSPRPRCNKTAASSKKRAAGRTWVCRQPELLAAAANPAVPVLWSRQLRRSQESFTNEKPFPTRKFDPFLEQLPEVSSLNHTWHGGCDHCDTCAVVGASGSLLNREHGELIDAHAVVFRPNWIRPHFNGVNYERHVGKRTHVNLFFGVEGMIDQFERAQLALPPASRAVGLVTPASDRSVASFFRHMFRIRRNQTRMQAGGVLKPQVYLMSDHIYLHGLSHLCGATGGGCNWLGDRSSTMRPSTGFLAVVLALQICRKVSLFGLSSDPCRPFHYYGPAKPSCTPEIPKENDERVHWFEKEHELYDVWSRQGKLTQYS